MYKIIYNNYCTKNRFFTKRRKNFDIQLLQEFINIQDIFTIFVNIFYSL